MSSPATEPSMMSARCRCQEERARRGAKSVTLPPTPAARRRRDARRAQEGVRQEALGLSCRYMLAAYFFAAMAMVIGLTPAASAEKTWASFSRRYRCHSRGDGVLDGDAGGEYRRHGCGCSRASACFPRIWTYWLGRPRPVPPRFLEATRSRLQPHAGLARGIFHYYRDGERRAFSLYRRRRH